MIIDTHSQLRTSEAIRGIKNGLLKKNEAVFHRKQDYTIEEMIEDMDKAGVDRSVIVAVDAEPYMRISNELVWDAVRRYPKRLIGFASVDPRKGTEAQSLLLKAIDEMGMKGLKFIPHLLQVFPNDAVFYPIYELAQDRGLPVLFHCGTAFHRHVKIKYSQPIYLDDVACDFPSLKIIIAHFGFPWYPEALALVQRHDSVYFNIAGWRPKHLPEMVLRYIDGPLAEKVLFGSDFPLISRATMIAELNMLGLKDSTLKKLLGENAQQILHTSA